MIEKFKSNAEAIATEAEIDVVVKALDEAMTELGV